MAIGEIVGNWSNCGRIKFGSGFVNYRASLNRKFMMGKKFQCPVCKKKLTMKGNLVSHQKSLYMGQRFQCLDCDYLATEKSILKRPH